MDLSLLKTYGHLAIVFLGALGTSSAAIQVNAQETGSGTPGWSYLVGLGLSALTTLLVARKNDPRVQQFEQLVGELNAVIEKANGTPAQTPAAPVIPAAPVNTQPIEAVTSAVESAVGQATNVVDEITRVIQTYQTKLSK